MDSPATIREEVLSANAAALLSSTIRHTITKAMNADCFTGAERKRAYQTIKECDTIAKLQSYQRGVYAEIVRRSAQQA